MFKKTMKFDDLNGDEVTQTFYFNFNKKEIAELLEFGCIQRFAIPGKEYIPLEEALEKLKTPVEKSGLTEIENNKMAYGIFEDLILDAYGEKGADNVTFNKTPALREYWASHVAYVEMIFEFLGDPKLAGQFIENCLPPKLVAKAKEELAAENKGKLQSETLAEMVAEAQARQDNPETAIEPGTDLNAPVAPEDDGGVPETKIEDLTEDDIVNMDDIAFKKLDPKKLSDVQLRAAFRRKARG